MYVFAFFYWGRREASINDPAKFLACMLKVFMTAHDVRVLRRKEIKK